MIKIVRALAALGERQGKTTIRAAKIITRALDRAGIAYSTETIDTFLPKASSILRVDGKIIDSAPTALVGGVINGKSALTSSLISSRYLIDVPNINFNPASRALSVSNFYFAPSLAIRSGDVPTVLKGKDVRGIVRVQKVQYSLPQILIGNLKNPSKIVFTHFDSIGPGAIDNASGTAVCLSLILTHPDLLSQTLFVFDSNEEVSYDYPTYWGHGYRVFEKRHKKLLQKAETILSIDSVGNGSPQVIRDPKILNLAFPIANLASFLNKTITIGGDIEKMMEVYQSEADLPQLLSEKYLEQTKQLALSLLCE